MESREVGCRITAQEQEYFRKGIKMFYECSSRRSLRRAYLQTLLKFFHIGFEIQDGLLIPILPPSEELPTFSQFSYLYNREFRTRLNYRSRQALIKNSAKSRNSER